MTTRRWSWERGLPWVAWLASFGAVARAEPPAAGVPAEGSCPGPSCEDGSGSVSGEVRVAGQRIPLPDASLIVMPAPPGSEPGDYDPPLGEAEPPWARSTRSDDQGLFGVDELPAGLVRVAVLVPGFERRDHIVRIDPGATIRLTLYVVPLEASPFRTVVAGAPPVPRSQVVEHRLTKEEIATLPGSQGDPLRALQNLPGVGRPPGGLGVLVIRGTPPGQSQVFLGGHAMPRAFHILSLASVFPADVLDELQYVPGNFDAAFGNATGGIVVIEPRRGRRDGVHGFGEVDLGAASAMVEGPIGRGSFIVGGQRGYVDAVLASAAAVTERVTGEPSSVLLPRYFDYQALLDHPLRGGATLGVRVFGAGDVLRARNSPEAADVSAFVLRTGFHRADLVYRTQWQGWAVRLTPSFRYESNRLVAAADTFRRRRRDAIGSARAELRHAVGRRAALTVGTDFELDGYSTLDEEAGLDLVTGQGTLSEDEQRGLQSSLGVYVSGELRLGALTLRPGARASAFSVGPRFAFAVDPRAVGELSLGERWQLSAGLGRYSQVRSIADRNEVDLVGQGTGVQGASAFLPSSFGNLDPAATFAPQDSSLNVREALHASAAVRVRLGDGGAAELGGFLNNQHNNVPPLDDGARNPFDSVSRATGLEALVRARVGRKLYGWVAYTLTFADLVLLQAPPGFDYSRRPSDYDQRHNLVALASYVLPEHWRIGGRFRLVSGLPYTPVVGSVALPGGHQPVFGTRNAARLPLSHQLDLRVDKQWIRDRASVTAYVDVQNVYNRVNPELVLYAADFRSEAGYVGLPIFPSLGVRVDW
ncbi:TonB-dependent receptor [Paraliomyxa miuraensis]|uniref:TonB-dependent receptor n=1 Tax=Paraliomyxa miuraensis TaxID=376150 RepID=UPI00225A0EBD|nr:TonB-dependent receptor [Paraliomyxa miuraensis]MCX4243763.1 TonB-dependent receptor plug domain-containing protein [Paraliomyxa miuraensis]